MPLPLLTSQETESLTRPRRFAQSLKTVLIDTLGFALVMWKIPAALLLVGTPIVAAIALGIAALRWIAQP